MKQYTHAWIALKAIERLNKVSVADANKKFAENLIQWFQGHKDGVISGAWYPDEVIKDMATSHVLKFTPAQTGTDLFRNLPDTSLSGQAAIKSTLYKKPYVLDAGNNLPQRCESLSHSVVDHMKIQRHEDKGSPVSPSSNQVALLLFMLSHYAADAHMPLHCDSRQFSNGINLHGKMEEVWEDEVKSYFQLDLPNERFYYDQYGQPLRKEDAGYDKSILKLVASELDQREFQLGWGTGNDNVGDFVEAVCQHSYLLAYLFIPANYNESNVTSKNWQTLAGQETDFSSLSVAVISDAVDAIARIWLRVWSRYMKWETQ